MPRPPEFCPHCGAEVPRDAKACPECGSDENTGWSEAATTDGLDLPDEEFDYDEFVQRELEERKSPVQRGLHWFWWLIALALLFVLMLWR